MGFRMRVLGERPPGEVREARCRAGLGRPDKSCGIRVPTMVGARWERVGVCAPGSLDGGHLRRGSVAEATRR
jgi:hypothetical protein